MLEYASIKTRCLQKQELWEDPDFPAVMSSLFYHQVPPFKFEWKRPKEIFNRPVFYSNKVCEIVPGKLGDTWLTMAMDVLQMYGGLFSRTVPKYQSLEEEYTGIFSFNMWSNGEWTQVLIDDRLPTVNGKLVFLQTKNAEVLWPALLEKAYAKVFGSYEALKYGNYSDGLTDLIGGIGQTLEMTKVTPRDLQKFLQLTTIVTAIYSKDQPSVPRADLDSGVYRVCHLKDVPTPNGTVYLIQIRKPTNSETVRGTRIVLNPIDWLQIPEHLDPPYCTWVLYSDFCRLFPKLDLLHLDESSSAVEPWFASKQKWIMNSCHGSWKKGVSAGGCKSETNHYFHTNPQILLKINEPDEFIICLYQRRIMDLKTIGFSIYKANNISTSRVTQKFFKKKSLFNTDFTNVRRMCYRWQAQGSAYLIIPSTFEPNEEADYSLRILSTQRLSMHVLDDPLCMGRPLLRQTLTWPDTRAFGFYETIFLNMADELKTVNVFELQEVLDACLPNDYIKSCCSLETCRQIILTMSKRDTERLTLSEFIDFMCNLQVWHELYKRYFREKVGVLKAERLREALGGLSFTVPESILSILILRFMKKDGMLRFCDFVCIVLYLYRIFDIHFDNDPNPQSEDVVEMIRLMIRC